MNEKPKMPKKPQLHQSHLQMLYRCGYKFEQIVLLGRKEPPSVPLVVGSATHAIIAKNLNNKIDKGHLLTKEAVQDFARDLFIEEWKASPIILTKDEKDQGIDKTRDKAQDQTIQMAEEHHYVIAPRLRPKAVERSWVLEAKGYPYDMSGTWDIDEEFIKEGAEFSRIRDTKTKKTNTGQMEVNRSEQYTFYALAKYLLDGKLPDEVVQDNLIKPTRTSPARALSYTSHRTKDDFAVAYRRFEQACKIIEKEAFTPANPTDWWCNEEWCGFACDGSCPYHNSKRTTIINKNGGSGNGKPKPKTGAELVKSLSSTIRNGN